MLGFYTTEELKNFNFKSIGKDVFISKKASIYSPEKISFGDNIRIDDFTMLIGSGENKEGFINIGSHIHIAPYCAIYGAHGVIMKDFSALSSRCVLLSTSDNFDGFNLTNPMIPLKYKPNMKKGTIILEKHVIIGTNSTVFPNIHLFEGAAIGAYSLINHDCKEWSIYFGIPAKKINDRKKLLLDDEIMFLKEYYGELNNG